MRIAALTYTFTTPKIYAGLQTLHAHGFCPSLVLAAPPVKLNFYKSKIPVARATILPAYPVPQIAETLGAAYLECPHNSPEACNAMREHGIDVAVILGARILKAPLIESVPLGIINLHPGILPINRGLDNLKWAVLLDMPQGATAHFIDTRIDAGRLIERGEVPVFRSDTVFDVFDRIQEEERKLLLKSLCLLKAGVRDFREIEQGPYRKSVPPELEADFPRLFELYKERRDPTGFTKPSVER